MKNQKKNAGRSKAATPQTTEPEVLTVETVEVLDPIQEPEPAPQPPTDLVPIYSRQIDIEPETRLQANKNKIDFNSLPDFTVEINPVNCASEFNTMVKHIGENKVIYYGDQSTKVTSPQAIRWTFNKLVEMSIPFNCEVTKLDEYSFNATFEIKLPTHSVEIKKGDVLNACFIVKSSGNMKHENGYEVAVKRLVCSNGLMRTTTHLEPSEELINFTLAHLQNQVAQIQSIMNKPVLWSQIQSRATIESIKKLGMTKDDIETAHFYLGLESEHAGELNAWIAYNAFNKALFETNAKSVNYSRRKQIDEKLFTFFNNLN